MNALFPLVAPLVGSGSTADSYVVGNPADVKMAVDSVVFIDDVGITANDTDYATISVELDGVVVATLSTTTTGSGTIAASTPVVVPVTNNNLVAAASGGKVEVKLAKAGSGVAVSGRAVVALKPHA